MHRKFTLAATVVTLLGLTAGTAQAANNADPTAAANKANDYVNGHPSKLHASSNDKFHQHAVITTNDGLQYVPYDRSYKGLKVRGGDFVVVTNASGDVAGSSVAQDDTINVSTTPTLTADQA